MSIYKLEHVEMGRIYLPLKKRVNQNVKKQKVIVIAGPTAVGKTDISISIAKILNAEIISADSMQVYKNMDIGTAKVTKEEQKLIPHHMIDLIEINQSFNVKDYFDRAYEELKKIIAKNKVPIIVGGSGFYIHVFLYGLPLGPPSDPIIRRQLEEKLQNFGAESLYERLQLLDPKYAKTITERDKHKIVRALEIIMITNKKVSDIPKPSNSLNDIYDFRLWFLDLPRDLLYKKIDQRCDEMIKKGFIEEVEKLKKIGIEKNHSASQAIGYRQCLNYLNSQRSNEERERFIQEFKKASRKFVKRQYTWFKKEKNFRWIDLNSVGMERAMEYILQDYEQS